MAIVLLYHRYVTSFHLIYTVCCRFLWSPSPYGIGRPYFCPVISIFFFSSPNLSRRGLDVYHTSTRTWCGLSVNLECMSETCCTRLAGNAGPKKPPKMRHLGTIAQICRAISSQLRHLSTIRKKMLSSNVSSDVPAIWWTPAIGAEICWRVWGTPAHFNRFRVLAALLHAVN